MVGLSEMGCEHSHSRETLTGHGRLERCALAAKGAHRVSTGSAHPFRRCYGIQFTTPGAGGSAVPLIREAMANGEFFRDHFFEYACARNVIEHRTTKPNHPWTTDVIDKSVLIGFAIFSRCAWVTAWRRAGSEVKVLPRSLYRRTSFAASVRTFFGPRGFQPATKRA
jgi:hypothetical protein